MADEELDGIDSERRRALIQCNRAGVKNLLKTLSQTQGFTEETSSEPSDEASSEECPQQGCSA